MLPQEKLLNKVCLGQMKDLEENCGRISSKDSPVTDSTFPPSSETLENALKRFPTKDDLEEAWSKENAHRFKGVIPKRSKEMIITYFILGSSSQ